MRAAAAAIAAAMALTGCSSSTGETDADPSAVPAASSLAPSRIASLPAPAPAPEEITDGVWEWGEARSVTLRVSVGGVVVVEGAEGATWTIADKTVVAFTGGNPVTLTGLRVGSTTGYIEADGKGAYFTVHVQGS